MMNVFSKCAAVLLSTACLAEGYYLSARSMSAEPPAGEPAARRERWAAELERKNQGDAPPVQAGREAIPGGSLEEWFQSRAGAAGIRSDISTTDKHIIVSFLIPGLKAETLHITVNSVRVTISCIARLVDEKKDADGSYRREAMRQYEMIMPLPLNADSSKHRVIREGETFKIIFEKRDDPTLKS